MPDSPGRPDDLGTLLEDGNLRLEPLVDAHLEPLRAACAEDSEIWEIYTQCLIGEHFDPAMAQRRQTPGTLYAVCLDGAVVGMTAYLRPDAAGGVVEIGGTYITPRMRGTGVNGRMKRLMLDHAFACGFNRIEFRIDERNLRSQAAVLKLGSRREALLRAERVTWTGHVRNTCLFGLLRED